MNKPVLTCRGLRVLQIHLRVSINKSKPNIMSNIS
jgi:hypothetical protein